MPELIERGYIYIAQPPLFRVRKGRMERYIKDEREMSEFLLKAAVDGVSVRSSGGPELTGKDLRQFLERLVEISGLVGRVDKHFRDRRIVDILLGEGLRDRTDLADRQHVARIAKAVEALGYAVTEDADEEHGVGKIRFREGSSVEREIGYAEISSAEYQRLVRAHTAAEEWDRPPFTLIAGEKETEIADRQELLDRILSLAKKGFQIQRYKGLGEMNPDQLWETTMDPAKRRLLQVHVSDAVGTDEIFSILMGDAVEPRRQFIQDNALDVRNLDV
jgi:DNA gyrase subunit B